MLKAVHLVKRFSGVTVVNDVSFEVRAGEVVGLPGGRTARGRPRRRACSADCWNPRVDLTSTLVLRGSTNSQSAWLSARRREMLSGSLLRTAASRVLRHRAGTARRIRRDAGVENPAVRGRHSRRDNLCRGDRSRGPRGDAGGVRAGTARGWYRSGRAAQARVTLHTRPEPCLRQGTRVRIARTFTGGSLDGRPCHLQIYAESAAVCGGTCGPMQDWRRLFAVN